MVVIISLTTLFTIAAVGVGAWLFTEAATGWDAVTRERQQPELDAHRERMAKLFDPKESS